MRLDVSVNMLTMQALTKGKITVFGGDQTRPNIHIDDITDLYLFLLDHPEHTGVYNAGFENISILDIAKMVVDHVPAELVVTPSNDPRPTGSIPTASWPPAFVRRRLSRTRSRKSSGSTAKAHSRMRIAGTIFAGWSGRSCDDAHGRHGVLSGLRAPSVGALDRVEWDMVERLAEDLYDCWKTGRQVFIAGNGGSGGNAIHLANDFLYALSKMAGSGLRVHALPANPAVLTCLANDEGYETVFALQLAVFARPDDLLIVFSGSGNSPNILTALEAAREIGMRSYARAGILGREGQGAHGSADPRRGRRHADR